MLDMGKSRGEGEGEGESTQGRDNSDTGVRNQEGGEHVCKERWEAHLGHGKTDYSKKITGVRIQQKFCGDMRTYFLRILMPMI